MAGVALSSTMTIVDFGQMTEDEKDEMSLTLSKENLEDSVDIQELKPLVNLLQGLLRFKVEQVVSLGLELDELASKQGQDEALLIKEIEGLRAQVSKGFQDSGGNGADTDDDLRQMLQASEISAQKLLAEVQAQEQEQLSNKMEIEKLESQLASVENDRLQLKQELSALRDEVQDQHKNVESQSQEPQRKHRQLVESLRQKNKHLSHLLNDVEASEKENVALREKLTNIKIELAEATKNIMHTTGEIVALQITKEELTEKVRYLEQICEALRQQVKDLVNEKERRDSELETFQQEIDVRVQEWKEIVAMKEMELNELKEQLAHQSFTDDHILKNFESDQIALLSQTLQKRESQIDMLQSKLSQATKDLNETTSLLENMHKASELSDTGPCSQGAGVTQKQLIAAEEKLKIVEGKLQDAETDADGKSEEITKLIIQLRAYETGEFGLSEALAQVKDLTQQRSVRDKHIEQLVETANMLKSTCDSLQEENLTLREHLKLSPEHHVQTSASVLKNKEQNVVKIQQQQIDRLEEDLISAKMDRRKLGQQVLALSKQLHESEAQPPNIQKTSNKQQTRSQADARATARKIRSLQQQQQQLSIERQSLVDENEALRQGLHDILDSVHNQDGKSSVRVESRVLEQLLHALDSRHISGWYHPAMRIQAKVNAVEGNNEALREQLHTMREEGSRTQNELQMAKLRIAELEEGKREGDVTSQSQDFKDHPYPKAKLDSAASCSAAELPSQISLPLEFSSQGWNVITKLNTHLIQVLHEHEIEKNQVSETLSIQRELQQELDALVSQLVHVLKQQSSDRLIWQEEKSELESEINILQSSLAASDVQITKLKSMYDVLSMESQNKRGLVEMSLSIASLSAEKEKSDRTAQASQQNANNARRQLQIIKSEWNASKEWLIRQFGDLLQFKKKMLLRLSDVELLLAESIPRASLRAANKRINETTSKYTELLRQHEIQVSLSDREMKTIMSELEQERKAKHDLWKQLEETNKKIWAWNNDISEHELSTQLAKTMVEVQREKEHASHAERMGDIVKVEIQQVSKRCKVLEEEVSALLKTNHQLKSENAVLLEALPLDNTAGGERDLNNALANARAEVLELQASQKHLQELADISQAQVHMLDQLHERSEHQLDALRQVMFTLQCETDLGAEIVRLSEELVSSQISEMAACNQISGLEKQCNIYIAESGKQTKEIEELQIKLNVEHLKYLEQTRKIQEQTSALSGYSDNSLPLEFFQLLVISFTQRSVECRELWYHLLEAKEELESVQANSEERKVSHQQTLELQNALQATHSDLECQRVMERWASQFTELKIKYLKSTRQCEALDSTLRQTQERIKNQDNLLSSIEQQLLSLDLNRPYAILCKDEYDESSDGARKLISFKKTSEKSHTVTGLLNDYQFIPPIKQETSQASKISTKEFQDNQSHVEEVLTSLREEMSKLTEHLKSKESELESYKNLCHGLKQSLDDQVFLQSHVSHISTAEATKDNLKSPDHDKAALQATVESLQNIIEQKEDTISRYQKILQDVREEDGRIISALQDHLRVQQADLTAQEQAYIKCKISMRHLALEASSNDNGSKASLDLHLSRSNELEDEVALLNSKSLGLSSELHHVQQEVVYWKSLAQQHLATVEELNIRLSEQKSRDKRPSLHENATSSKEVLMISNEKSLQESQESFKGYRTVDGSPKTKANPIQFQLSAEVAELRSRIHQMEDQERQHKSEIQRLREQIPIYSRRTLHAQNGNVLPEREADLLKRIKFLEHQLVQQKIEHEKILTQRCQQESKKIKSVENVARWDERKKYQIQIERLKSSLREQTDETAILHDKVERMHATVHRLEREKIALEQQIRGLRHLEQDKAILEERLKSLEGNDVPQCIFDELQQERNKLLAEVKMLRAKGAVSGKERNVELQSLLDDMKLERNKLYSELKILQAKVAYSDQKQKVESIPDTQQKERADFQKVNLELECQNLELKLELEKLHSEAPCLRHKVMHLERLLQEMCEQNSSASLPGNIQGARRMENKNLQLKIRHLTEQLDTAHHRLKTLESMTDHSKIAALQEELNQKSLLLSKVKTLLERAAIKERQLSDQVYRLESVIVKSK